MEDHSDTNSVSDAELNKVVADLSILSSSSNQREYSSHSTNSLVYDSSESEVRSESDIEVGEDGFGILDYFSRLNDLCILEVFKHLTREEIHTMSKVNSRMNPFANERSLDCIKWKGGDLCIWQYENGFRFMLEFDDDGYSRYDYTITRKDDGRFTETKEVYEEWRSSTILSNSKSMLDYLFTAMTDVLRKRNVDYLSTFSVSIEYEFMIRLERVLRGHSTTDFIYFPVKDEIGPDDGRKVLARIMKGAKEVHLDSTEKVFNEHFIRDLAGGRVKFISAVDHACHPVNHEGVEPAEKLEHFFTPDRSILPLLMGYDVFAIPTLVLKSIWIANLTILCFEFYGKTRSDGRLQFSVDQLITPENITALIRDQEYEYKFEQGNHHIMRRRDGMQVKIKTVDYTVEGQVVHGVILHVSHEDTHEE